MEVEPVLEIGEDENRGRSKPILQSLETALAFFAPYKQGVYIE